MNGFFFCVDAVGVGQVEWDENGVFIFIWYGDDAFVNI